LFRTLTDVAGCNARALSKQTAISSARRRLFVREDSTVGARQRLQYFVVRAKDDLVPVEFEFLAVAEGFAGVNKAKPLDGAFARAQTKA
jgi:hypothetical protein